jgi:hypothetical protein
MVDAMERFARLLVDILAECTRVGMALPFTLLIYGRDGSPRKFRIEKTERVSEILRDGRRNSSPRPNWWSPMQPVFFGASFSRQIGSWSGVSEVGASRGQQRRAVAEHWRSAKCSVTGRVGWVAVRWSLIRGLLYKSWPRL